MDKLLTANFKYQHAELVSIILKTALVNKIYLLGSTLIKRKTESIFIADNHFCPYVSHYYILVVINNEHKQLNAVQDKIENSCGNYIPVTAIVLHTGQFNAWLMEGHQFARTVCDNAMLLHGVAEIVSGTSGKVDKETIKVSKETIYNQGLNKVIQFLAGADLYRIREQNKMAAFMLHQATEHALHNILKTTTGLYINTHNIDKLLRYCSMGCCKLSDIFPTNNEKNERLFQLLQRAYIDTRYKEDYSISITDLLIINKRVVELQQVMQETYNLSCRKMKEDISY